MLEYTLIFLSGAAYAIIGAFAGTYLDGKRLIDLDDLPGNTVLSFLALVFWPIALPLMMLQRRWNH